MTGTRMYGIGDGVDEEHVDAYCCEPPRVSWRVFYL